MTMTIKTWNVHANEYKLKTNCADERWDLWNYTQNIENMNVQSKKTNNAKHEQSTTMKPI